MIVATRPVVLTDGSEGVESRDVWRPKSACTYSLHLNDQGNLLRSGSTASLCENYDLTVTRGVERPTQPSLQAPPTCRKFRTRAAHRNKTSSSVGIHSKPLAHQNPNWRRMQCTWSATQSPKQARHNTRDATLSQHSRMSEREIPLVFEAHLGDP